jgi:hypothetical protein
MDTRSKGGEPVYVNVYDMVIFLNLYSYVCIELIEEL